MYTDEDLDLAVEKGIFSAAAIKQFRHLQSTLKSAPSVDQENFKLLTGFNDIFVVIACCLLLFSSLWMVETITDSEDLGLLVMVIISWCLAEIFVLKRQLALPAIVLLLAFVGGVYMLCMTTFSAITESTHIPLAVAAGVSTLAAYLHWWRFQVPITIAVGTGAGAALVVALVVSFFPDAKHWLLAVLFLCGLLIFALAMYWDMSDINRVTRRSDVSFWLHLLAAPLIIHPVFSYLGILDGNESLRIMVIVILLYLLT